MEIKSFYGNYNVIFSDAIPYKKIKKDGDIAVIDRKVFELYASELENAFGRKERILINATEDQKSYSGVIPIIDELIKYGFRKNNTLIAVGGGITQDVVAFISSILYRGVQWKFIPTTLLSQCDSCIGSKTSINFESYKNQIGGFYPPREIYISSKFLSTLHEKEIKSGLGEMLHYYVVGGRRDFEFLADTCMKAINDGELMQKLIEKSLKIKKEYIEKDEFDKNERQIFNYGHSFGHALESLTRYELPHGIAVSHGMDIANYVAVKMGIQKLELRDRIKKVASLFWSEGDIPQFDIDEYIELLKKDKKNSNNMLGVILCSDFGSLHKHMIENDRSFQNILKGYFDNMKA